jgi:DNA polymerase III delta prime subunit
LKSVYGTKVEKVKVDFKGKTKIKKIKKKEMKVGASGQKGIQKFINKQKEVTLTVVSSPHHIVLNPSEVGYYDRWVVSQMIKEIAQSVPLTSNTDDKKFKIVVLHEVDKLTKEAQQALRSKFPKN